MKLILTSIIFLFSSLSLALSDVELKTFRDLSVMVVNQELNHGGTGSIVQSNNSGSIILTNKHVCGVVEEGGFVINPDGKYKVTSFKKYTMHDLCLIKIKENLKQSLKVATHFPQPADRSFVTGHPMLLPNIITEGHFSDRLDVQVLIDVRPCTAAEEQQDPMTCMFMGFPIVENYKSQVVSNLIQPGNSGSAVLNSKGELAGVVFAGSGEIGFGMIVPQDFVSFFITNHSALKWEQPHKSKPTKQTKTSRRDEAQDKCFKTTDYPNSKVAEVCEILKRDMIFRGK